VSCFIEHKGACLFFRNSFSTDQQILLFVWSKGLYSYLEESATFSQLSSCNDYRPYYFTTTWCFRWVSVF